MINLPTGHLDIILTYFLQLSHFVGLYKIVNYMDHKYNVRNATTNDEILYNTLIF